MTALDQIKVDAANNCTNCGAGVKAHRHSLTTQLLPLLQALGKAGGGPIHLRELHLSHEGLANFQKLRYFGLVAMHGSRRSGIWSLTPHGRKFLAGESSAPAAVWTFRTKTIKRSRKRVKVTDVMAKAEKYDDFAASAVRLGTIVK